MLKHIRRLAGAAGTLAAAIGFPSAAIAAEAQAAPRHAPALWKLADEDTTIYLFGTIHLLPKDHVWRTPLLDRAAAEADELVLETTIDADASKASGTVMSLGVSDGLPPLVERVPADKQALLRERLTSLGVKPEQFDRFETWAASISLLAASFRDIGLSPEAGVERTLAGELNGTAKKVVGLETVEQQFGFLDSLSEEAQRLFLLGVLDDPERARAQFKAMLDAWTVGDVDGIARTFDSETALSPELRDVLMKKRNATWADWLEQRLAQPGTVLVAVGAGHLAGADSVQTMLAAKGLTVERLQ